MNTYVRESLEKIDENSCALVSRYAKSNPKKILKIEDAILAVVSDSK